MPADAIADAARLLIAEASPTTIRTILRLLLDDVAPAAPAAPVAPGVVLKMTRATTVESPQPRPAQPAQPAQPVRRRRRKLRAKAKVKVAPNGGGNGVSNGDWEALRRQVLSAMTTRQTDFETLAAATGCSRETARANVYRRKLPSARFIASLRQWLATEPPPASEAEEVDLPALPFRGARGNGSGAAGSHAGSHAGRAAA
jgi:hypothetical protein